MLTSLCIENFTIVSHLELDFSHGMTAFTGETGAGKSIMIDALLLALGGRGDPSVIRPHTDKCEIHAIFHIDAHSVPQTWLITHDIEPQEQCVILRRVIHQNGRSKSYINGQPFPLQKVKELSQMLVDIHGQHQHQSLLLHSNHRKQLDQFANHAAKLKSVENAFRQYQSIKKALQDLEAVNHSVERIELLQYQINELTALDIKENEFAKLQEEHKLLHHAKDYLEAAQQIHDSLSSDENWNVSRVLNQILQWVSALPQDNTNVKNTVELIHNAIIQCEEANDEMTHFVKQIPLDPERLQDVETRMSTIHETARKHHVDARQLPKHLQTLENELEQLQNRNKHEQELKERLQKQQDEFQALAIDLRKSRQLYAKKLSEAITHTMQQLGMPQGYVLIDITPLETMQPHGLDRIEYLVCTNPGMKPDALAKIASGGELSRISLAIELITAQRGSTPTLLFDEVDVGIGGATAALVGKHLRELGKRLQVFCVTHQPQVASSAHHHFLVEKHTENEQTFSKIIPLESERKITEIARMLGGLKVTEQTRSHAKELLSLSSSD